MPLTFAGLALIQLSELEQSKPLPSLEPEDADAKLSKDEAAALKDAHEVRGGNVLAESVLANNVYRCRKPPKHVRSPRRLPWHRLLSSSLPLGQLYPLQQCLATW